MTSSFFKSELPTDLELAKLLAAEISGDAWGPFQQIDAQDTSIDGAALRARDLYRIGGSVLEDDAHRGIASMKASACGILFDIGDVYATRSYVISDYGDLEDAIPTKRQIEHAIVFYGLVDWAEELGVSLDIKLVGCPKVFSQHETGDSHRGKRWRIKSETRDFIGRVKQALDIYETFVSSNAPARFVQPEMQRISSAQVAVARRWASWAHANLGDDSLGPSMALLTISRSMFVLSWFGETGFPSAHYLRKMLDDDETRKLFRSAKVVLPSWISST